MKEDSRKQDFRWRALLQHSREPLFILNRRSYLLFINKAFEQLARLEAAQLYRLWCRRPQPARPGQSWKTVLKHVLTPPAEVLQGLPGRHRRLIPARSDRAACWWDVDFFPLRDEQGFRGVLGKITPGPEIPEPLAVLVPEEALHLRQRMLERLNQVYLGLRLPAMRRVAEQLRLASHTHSPALLVGAAGTGKRTLARLIHYRSAHREQAFAALDCRRLPSFAVSALLWGEAGAAARAPLGTVYLLEPPALPRDVQERLHRYLIGPETGDRPRLRIISGFREDPLEAVRRGELLEELAHALATLRIDLPTLAQRHDDLPHLVDRMLRRLESNPGKKVYGLTPDAWEILLAYAWPGNLRELFVVLQGAGRHAPGEAIDAGDLPAYIRQVVRLSHVPAARPERALHVAPIVEQVEQRLIELALRRAQGKKNLAAKLLDVPVPWLFRRLKKLQVEEEPEPPETE